MDMNSWLEKGGVWGTLIHGKTGDDMEEGPFDPDEFDSVKLMAGSRVMRSFGGGYWATVVVDSNIGRWMYRLVAASKESIIACLG